jgi:hypothetical protein
MNDEIDRIRKENGWKPRKRGKPGRRGRGSGSSNGGETPNNSAAADEHVKLLQKLQVKCRNISNKIKITMVLWRDLISVILSSTKKEKY